MFREVLVRLGYVVVESGWCYTGIEETRDFRQVAVRRLFASEEEAAQVVKILQRKERRYQRRRKYGEGSGSNFFVEPGMDPEGVIQEVILPE